MKDSGKYILNTLIDKYENSIVSKQGTSRNIKQEFKFTKQNMKKYFEFGNSAYKQKVNHEVFSYETNHWVSVDFDADFDEIHSVVLNVQYVKEICAFLKRTLKADKAKELMDVLRKYENTCIRPYVMDVVDRIQSYKPYQSLICDDMNMMKDLLVAMVELLQLNEEVYERVFSVKVLKDSKAFAKIQKKIVMILKNYYGANQELEDDEILSEYNIIKNPGFIAVKGIGVFKKGNSVINLEDFDSEFLISSNMIDDIEMVNIPVNKVITIENLTSFYQTSVNDALLVYLGGFPNHLRRKFLLKVYELIPNVEYYHFGDIDAGGMNIYSFLKESTCIPFKPLKMDVDTLVQYKEQCISLTSNDRERLNRIKESCFKSVVQYMLENNIKLEQENVVV